MNNTDKILKGLFSLDHNIKIYIPSNVRGQEIDSSDYTEKAMELFSKAFGGSTSYEALGAWQSDTTGLTTERIQIVESYATKEQMEENLISIVNFATALKAELQQEAISLEYDNKLYFI